ncbi:MAG: exosome complex exonuclease Rrp41 [Candidatus Diapherotrites archaeon]|nr:exosome complex exonuclease Rrp41 [Candidatus Diapherotrites archaeon]
MEKSVYERPDGRKIDELRKIKIVPSVLTRADGSAYIEWGQNKAIVGVFGPREALPQHIQNPTKALVNYVYRMATFSVPERKSAKPGRREIEISKVSGEALESAIFVERFANATIDIYAYLFDSNAGTRCAALTAASVALADAGIPMRDLVPACAVGRANGQLIVDPCKEEEDAEDAVDMPMAILPRNKEVVLLQMDGLLSLEEWKKAFHLGLNGCMQVYEIQKKAIKEKYESIEKEDKKAIEALNEEMECLESEGQNSAEGDYVEG